MSTTKGITVCRNHPEYPVPLIWTFAFPGAEYWCPYCGATTGMFGGGSLIESTPELEKREELYKQASDEYLDACSTFACDTLEFEGKRMKPADLPETEKERVRAIIKAGFKYKDIEIEKSDFKPKEL